MALVTMVQAADCSDEDPLVEFDSPALAREDDLFVGLFEGRMKIKNDSKKSRWDLASDGFWSKKSIRATFPPLTKTRKGVSLSPGFFRANHFY